MKPILQIADSFFFTNQIIRIITLTNYTDSKRYIFGHKLYFTDGSTSEVYSHPAHEYETHREALDAGTTILQHALDGEIVKLK